MNVSRELTGPKLETLPWVSAATTQAGKPRSLSKSRPRQPDIQDSFIRVRVPSALWLDWLMLTFSTGASRVHPMEKEHRIIKPSQ